jgi:hypothetical protein
VVASGCFGSKRPGAPKRIIEIPQNEPEKAFKVSDRDEMYVAVLPTGTVLFRFDYRINGRCETLTIGRCVSDFARAQARDPDTLSFGMDVSLREARTLLDRARRDVKRGVSPSRAKVENRLTAAEALAFAGWAESYFKHKADPKSGAEQLAESTLSFRRSTYRRVLEPELGKLKLEEVTPQRLMRLCDETNAKRGPAVAIHALTAASSLLSIYFSDSSSLLHKSLMGKGLRA